jgi:hypothetical protein
MFSKKMITTTLLAILSWVPSALAQYETRVGVFARVEDGCSGEWRELYVTDFRKFNVEYGSAVYKGFASVPQRCNYREGIVRAEVTIRVPSHSDYVDYNGFLVEPLNRNAYAECQGTSSWRRYTSCHVDLYREPSRPPRPPQRPPRPPRPPEPPPYNPNPPPYNPPPYQPPQPPPRPPVRPPARPPVTPPPSQGSPLVVTTEVDVGCRGRVAPVTVTNLSLVSDDGRYLTFSGFARVNHKCGDTKNIGATVNVTIHRADARVNQSGILLSPAVNSSVNCVGQSGFVGGPTRCRVISQN